MSTRGGKGNLTEGWGVVISYGLPSHLGRGGDDTFSLFMLQKVEFKEFNHSNFSYFGQVQIGLSVFVVLVSSTLQYYNVLFVAVSQELES